MRMEKILKEWLSWYSQTEEILKNVVKEIKAVDDKAMIISSETSNLSGGYMRQIRHLIK